MTRNFLSLVTFDVKAGYTKSDKIGIEVAIKDMPHIYKLTLCLWTKFPRQFKSTTSKHVHPVSYLGPLPDSFEDVSAFGLSFDGTSKGQFFVASGGSGYK